eukprot:7068817-Alexandrium_andersonii.AAC.1
MDISRGLNFGPQHAHTAAGLGLRPGLLHDGVVLRAASAGAARAPAAPAALPEVPGDRRPRQELQ